MSPTSAAGDNAPVPLLSDRLSWQQVKDLDRDEAVSRVVYEYRRHRATFGFGWWPLIVVASAVALLTAADVVLGMVAAAAAFGVPLWRDHQVTGAALDAIAATDPPLGRLHVIVVMLSHTRPTCDLDMLTRLLTNAPDELSCAALGRHLDDYCPHATTVW